MVTLPPERNQKNHNFETALSYSIHAYLLTLLWEENKRTCQFDFSKEAAW